MEYCTYLKYYELTCLSLCSCCACPYWSKNVRIKCEEKKRHSTINASMKLTHKISKAETCKNYSYWCGKLEHIKACETCKFYEN